MNGLDFIEHIRNELPDTRFIIFSCHDSAEYYRRAIRLGVSEYIQKSAVEPEEILAAVERIASEIRFERAKRTDTSDAGEFAPQEARKKL